MNYTLHQLKVFLKVSQTKSITKAAEELNLSQPAVSIQLKNLQDQFEIPLTEVVGRQLYITDFGKEIATAVEQIVNEVSKINYKSLAYKGILTGVLKIAVVSTGKYVMPFFLSDFMNSNKGIELEMDVTNKARVFSALKNNEIDFALVSNLPDDINLEYESLMANKMFLIGGKNLTISEEFTVKKLLQEVPLIYREEGSATRVYMENYIKHKGLTIKSKIQLTSNEAVKQSVISGLGISIMPLIGLKNELENGDLKIIDFEDLPIITEWNLIWLKNKKMSPVGSAYLQYVQTEKNNIFTKLFSWIKNY